MQGADRVNDELEVGFDESFEKRWRVAEQIGHLVMVLFVAASLGGLLGRGPFSHSTTTTSASALAVDFEPVARSQSGTQVTFHLDNTTADPILRLFVGGNFVEPMGLLRIVPQPVNIQAVEGGLLLTVAIPAGTHDADLRMMLNPVGIGQNHLIAQLAGHEPLRWTQVVAP